MGSIFPGQQGQEQSCLDQFTVDLTKLAEDAMNTAETSRGKGSPNKKKKKKKKMDPIIGRHDEIRRCLQILARRTKNNPVLIGNAGVGKTAIAEGLAQRIVTGQVPESMKNKRVLSLDVASMVSGAMMRGMLEQRLKGLLEEIQDSNGEVILFIDELHMIMQVGKGGGDVDMSNLLKPALARGELQLLGATTLDEYRILEKDAAMARRFQSVYVKEPNMEDTLSILRGLKPTYELHHAGIRVKDEALVAAATLSDRYITDRFQPDKSIDLVDEACSKLRLEQESKPDPLWNKERQLLTKQIELSALENEEQPDNQVKERLAIIKEQVAELQEEVDGMTTEWQNERNELTRVKDVKEELAAKRHEMEVARSKGDFNKAGELLHGIIPRLETELQELENDNKNNDSEKLLAHAVTAETIASIVARHTGIPVTKLTGEEGEKLLTLEDDLRKRVVGQDHALEAVANCVRLSRTGLQATDKTLGNFLFLGPSGVGKTELCKTLAARLFENENAMTRIDMSEFGEKHTVSRLIGAPPGYVGYEQGGVLTESVRRRPYQVLLLDEFEKAHPDVWNLLLQLFDDGRLSDSHGNVVDFSNVMVIMTSNLGANLLAELPPQMMGSEPEVVQKIMDGAVRKRLSPELINRIDDIVVFNRLQRDHMDQIAEMGIAEIAERLRSGQQIELEVSQAAKDCLAERGYDVRYGARPLKRVLVKEVLNPLSRLVLEGTILNEESVRVVSRGEALQLQKRDTGDFFGWESGASEVSQDKNDVVILRNHAKGSQAARGVDIVNNDDDDDNHGPIHGT